MLTNEIYIGNMVQGKYGSVSYKTKQNKPRPKEEWYRVEGTHEPIIDRELWDRVQSMVAEKAKPFTVGTIGLFARKARCMTVAIPCVLNKQTDGRHYLTMFKFAMFSKGRLHRLIYFCEEVGAGSYF